MWGKVLPLLLAGAVLLTTPPARAAEVWTCFPSCQPDDGRFLVLAGSAQLNTLSGMPITVRFQPRERGRPFKIELFDGDMRYQGTTSRWDHVNAYDPTCETRTLYSVSPCLDATCQTLAPAIATAACGDTPDNDWYTFQVPGDVRYADYLFQAELEDVDTLVTNQFKLRTDGRLLLTRHDQPFAFLAAISSPADAQTVYPELDPLDLGFNNPQKITENMVGARYDGTFRFPLEVTAASTGQCDGPRCLNSLALWDGDLDRGGYDGRPYDTDDPDTPAAIPPFAADLPDYAKAKICPEGIAMGMALGMGAPPDEADPTYNGGLNRYYCRPPSIEIEITAPDGRVFRNDNPSGNREWERFRITEDPALPADVHVEQLPWGLWSARLVGMDHNNLNAWYCECTVLGVAPGGCTPGYWKQPHHFDSWGDRFAPDDLFDDVFGIGLEPGLTLRQALSRGGGKNKALRRHAVAALLNAAQAGVDYSYAEAEVIATVQAAYLTGSFEWAKSLLAAANERGCPLN